MADGTHIEWTDATWNPVTGCSVVSPGCTNCYAMKLAGTRLQHHWSRKGLTRETKAGPVWTGEVRFNREWLTQPLSWKRPRKVFVCAHGDLFAEGVPDEWIDQVFAVMALAGTPSRSGSSSARASDDPTAGGHQFQVLTKRPERMRAYVTKIVSDPQRFTEWAAIGSRIMRELGYAHLTERQVPPRWPLPNVWLGTSIEDQKRADERVPQLLATPAAVRFVSAEPLLGPIDIGAYLAGPIQVHHHPDNVPSPALDRIVLASVAEMRRRYPKLDWVIVGGESGDGARPMHPDWARTLRDQCAAAGVPFFFKQWGAWAPHSPRAGGDLGGDIRAGRVDIVHPTGQSTVEVSFATGGRSTVPGSRYMALVGKTAAGRLLDGIEHNGMPGGAA